IKGHQDGREWPLAVRNQQMTFGELFAGIDFDLDLLLGEVIAALGLDHLDARLAQKFGPGPEQAVPLVQNLPPPPLPVGGRLDLASIGKLERRTQAAEIAPVLGGRREKWLELRPDLFLAVGGLCRRGGDGEERHREWKGICEISEHGHGWLLSYEKYVSGK